PRVAPAERTDRSVRDLGADLGAARLGARPGAPPSRRPDRHHRGARGALGRSRTHARRRDALALAVGAGQGRRAARDRRRGGRPDARVPDGAPGPLLRLQGTLPLEEEVRSELRRPLPGLSDAAVAAARGARAGPGPESRWSALLPAPPRTAPARA